MQKSKLLTLDHLIKLSKQLLSTNDVSQHIPRNWILFLSIDLIIGRRLDCHDFLVVVLGVKVLQWNGTDWCVGVILLESGVGDER